MSTRGPTRGLGPANPAGSRAEVARRGDAAPRGAERSSLGDARGTPGAAPSQAVPSRRTVADIHAARSRRGGRAVLRHSRAACSDGVTAEYLRTATAHVREARARAVEAIIVAERAIESASLVREESEALRQVARQLRGSRD